MYLDVFGMQSMLCDILMYVLLVSVPSLEGGLTRCVAMPGFFFFFFFFFFLRFQPVAAPFDDTFETVENRTVDEWRGMWKL